ncbi:hypothetical protein GCM10010954_13940 [Halobacillus andaensis]|uniref:DUF1499 domain-containing protein n=1 Tax=Halobacillus andaensis TaxID=1176239 RepID=A0A917B3M5_HALAA|nr:DUF1499 domain-containing protein [Halobacillus andaensis]MBP2004196.1 uncharacterized protein (DUF1499 family) [Halobacillus andaensis]GGF16544.1 hypothetical protein GCM10010954_13940 [Halobacillus andaensis]
MSQSYLGVKDGCLAPCPKSPNCVSTQTDQKDKRMEPLPFIINTKKTKDVVKSITQEMKRVEMQDEAENYLHLTFTSKVLRFKDDVEFYLDEESKFLHFRSASRMGYSDLGVNRKRMEEFSKRYAQKYESEASS